MDTLLETFCAPCAGVRLLWLGNDGWLLWDGAHLIATDLDLLNVERLLPSPVEVGELANRLDLHFITHAHEDHFSTETCRILLEQGRCRFVVPESCSAKAAEIGIPKNRMIFAAPGDRFCESGAEVECIRAIHGHVGGAVYSGASVLDCGYRFHFGGKCFYEPGDTLLLEEHQTMEPADVLFVSPTEHNTWIDGSKWLVERLKPRHIFPQHFGTYGEEGVNRTWFHGYVEELQEALSPMDRDRFRIPRQGEIIEIDGR